MEAVNGVSEGDKGVPPAPSPLTGCYLLIVIGEPHCNEHKDIILQKVVKGLLSWDVSACLVDLEKELAIITEQALEGEEARYGERLIQFASENLVTEILIHPVVSTLAQCVRNLLSSFTRHRHIIHAGYTFANNGSWVLQDGTFSSTDFAEAFQELEVLRVIKAYENGISLDIHCAPEGDWTRLPKESFTKGCKVRVNPNDVLTAGTPSITSFINYVEPFLVPAELENVLESSDVVGNIRFSRPTLYVFPGGQGDAALFGINGFNMLLDGGFSRKACFWDFVRHLDRLDAVLLTRLNNSNVNGISAVLKRKRQNALYPQLGHFFCNIQERKAILSPDGDKDKDLLLINLLEEGQEIVSNLRHLSLIPQVCYRDSEPINLYHKVGHGTLDMYVLSPAKDSKEVREFLHKWNNNDQKLFANPRINKEFVIPLQNLVSICALLVWQPANPEDTITRILFPGSSPQSKILEGLDKIKSLEFVKHPVCSEKSLTPTAILKTKQSVVEKIIQAEKKISGDNKKAPKSSTEIINTEIKNGEVNGIQTAPVKKSDSTESEKSVGKPKKAENEVKLAPKLKVDSKSKPRSDSQQRKAKAADKKPSPTTPKKQVEKMNGEPPKPKSKPSPTSTPAKSAKEANNRKVLESKIKAAPKKEQSKPVPDKKEVKPERKPISRRPKEISKPPGSPSKKVNGVQKPDTIAKRGKLDKEGTTDSSTVSTPSADQDSILKKDISKLTSEEIQDLKAQELADLKEEQEAVKEIEAVFRKGELREDKPSDFRKIKDLSIDDKLESEEYLIIEKTEIEQDQAKEEETQKIARDSEESEKQRKLSVEEAKIEEQRTEIQEELQKIITSATDIVKTKEEPVEASKEVSATSPEDKIDTSDKKEEEIKEVAQESQPDEKGSANIESGATTTAPTLPEDERMPLDEIKEDNGDQVIEEKHVKEDTKEKDVPVIQLPPKVSDNTTKLPPVVGIRLDKQSHIRDIVKTPDEVADLPVHEEAEFDHFDEYPTATEVKEVKAEPEGKKDEKEAEKEDQKVDNDKVNKSNFEVAVDKVKTDVGVKTEIKKEDVLEATSIQKESVISEDLNKKELSKSPDDEKDTDEHELIEKQAEIKEKQQEGIKDKQEEVKEITEKTPIEAKLDDENIKDNKAEEARNAVEEIEDLKNSKHEAKDAKEVQIVTKLDQVNTEEKEKEHEELTQKESNKQEVQEKCETEIKATDDFKEIEELKKQLPEVPKHEIETEKEKLVTEEEKTDIKEKIEPSRIEDVSSMKKVVKDISEDEFKTIEEVVTHKVEAIQHAESVVITTDSLPESPAIEEKRLIEDKLELGRKSPKEREEDVAKIVASVAEVLKSDAPLEEFEGKIPFSIPYKSYTTELRETHITTVESPLSDNKPKAIEEIFCPKASSTYLIEEERRIAPIHEESELQESKISKMIKDSNDLMQATSRMIQDIKKNDVILEDPIREELEGDSGTVHRMLVTASSEDGGEETEICPAGTIIFSKSSESSGRSSPELQSQKISQKSSTSDATVINKAAPKEIENGITSIEERKNVVPVEPVLTKEIKKDIEAALEIVKDAQEELEIVETLHKTDVIDEVTETIKLEKDHEVPEKQDLEKRITDIKDTKDFKDEVAENKVDLVKDDHIATTKENAEEDKVRESILGGFISSMSTAVVDGASKLIEDTKKEVEEIQSKAKSVTQELKEDILEKTGKVDSTAQTLKDSLIKESSIILTTGKDKIQGVVETSESKLEEAKENITSKKEELVETTKELQTTVSQNLDTIKASVVAEIKDTKQTIEDKVKDIKENIISQKDSAVSVIDEVKEKVSKDVETKINEVVEIKESTEKKIDETIKSASEQVHKEATDLKSEFEAAYDKTKTTIQDNKMELEKTKEKIEENAAAEIKTIESKATTILEEAKSKEDDVIKKIEQTQSTLVEKKEETETELKSAAKSVIDDVSKLIPDKEEDKHKYDLYNGLENVEKMVVDVLTADREDPNLTKSQNETEFSVVPEKLQKETVASNILEKLKDETEIKGDVLDGAKKVEEKAESKDVTSFVDKVEQEVESIFDKGISEVKELVEETKEAFTSFFKSETCEIKDIEKKLERSAESLEKDYETVTDMSKSIVFEKCDKPSPEEQKEEKILEKSAKDLETEYEAVTDMAKSIQFEKCELLTEVEKEERALEKRAESLEKDYETVMDQAKSITFEKCEKPLTDDQKEERALEKSAKDIEENYKIVSDMSQSIVFEKCEKSPTEEDKQSSGKSTPEANLACKLPGTSSPALSVELNKESGKNTPEPKEVDHIKIDNQDSLLSGKSSPGISGKSSPILSGKSTPDARAESKDSLLSGKSTPEQIRPDDKESTLSGKLTPEVDTVKKSTTQAEDKTSTQSTPIPSGKASPLSTQAKPNDTLDSSAKGPDIPVDVTSTTPEKKTELEKDRTEPEALDKKSLVVEAPVEKKLSISDVQITMKTDEEKASEKSTSDLSKTESPEDIKQIDSKLETKDISIDSGIFTEADPKTKRVEDTLGTESIAGPSASLSPNKGSSEELHLSGKSTPDIADIEKIKESLKSDTHIPGSSTPPTVPVSPNIKDREVKAEDLKTVVKSVKDSELRSYTPGSDDYEIGTQSDISSGQVSRALYVLEGERVDSDEDDDVPGSPMSVTSQVAHSRSSSRYDFEDERIGTKLDPMNTSFYGALPDEEDPDLDFENAMAQHRQARGEDLTKAGAEYPPSYLYEVTKAKFSKTPEPNTTQMDQINKNGASDVMTASFMGDLSSKDPLESWGKPLGLPSPAPPNDNNKGTPKKERKLPSNVSAKNKLNDDRKRSESPSKYKNRKINPIYVDLTYVPHHGNAYYSYVDFFKKVRARYYVFSGIEPSREVYNALLEAKQTWDDKELEVTIIPTYDTDILGYWVAENEELLTKYKIDLSPSASRCTINLQDHETSCSAYRLEF